MFCFQIHSTINRVAFLASVVTKFEAVFLSVLKRHCTAGLSFDDTIMEYADDEHCDLLSTLFAVMVELVLMHVNTWYGIQDYVIERLM
jgi:hypothetical protein